MTQEQEYEIIDLVVKIFQNVGIKRCIDKIDILKNYQIYFQICKVIFPQTMIQLLRFSEGPQTNAQKIQGVISIVGKILQNDLYHISGEAIAEGKLSHIRNFLHILELLSENVHKGNRNEQQVESAPQNTRSISDYDQQGHYTVIGIDKEFERQFDDEEVNHENEDDSDEPETKREYQQRNGKQNDGHTDNEDSQSERPMNPVLDKKDQNSKKKFVKTTQPRAAKYDKKFQKKTLQIHQVKPQTYSKPYPKPIDYSFKKKTVSNVPKFEQFIKQRQPKEQIRKKAKSAFVKKINNIIEDFEAKKLTDMKLEYNIEVKKQEMKSNEKENQIEQENRQRMEFTDQLIVERRNKIYTLRNAKQAVNIMANLFKEQRNIWRGMRKAKQETELEQIQALIQGDVRDQQLLRQALMAGNPGNFVQKRR